MKTLPHVRIGRSRRVRREDLEKYIQSHKEGGGIWT
ncbi:MULTISPECIES: helix-turn-helix domain-containing protein [Thermanaerothrix]